MWQQIYAPVAGSLLWSALVASLPVFALLFVLTILRWPAWKASLAGLAAAILLALAVYHMPAALMLSSVLYGAAFGLFPIGWIVFAAILLYRVTLETGKFEIIKDSIALLTTDPSLQALLIAFAFGAFIEGASGFGTPVAVCAAMLTGLGFPPFQAAAICLLANTAPVAFGSIGIPVVTLAGITGLPLAAVSGNVGRICAPVSLFVPGYLIKVLGGWKAVRAVLPAVMLCGVAFAGMQFVVSNFVSVYLTDILASLASILVVIAYLRFSKRERVTPVPHCVHHSTRDVFWAWAPYGLLVIFVCLWGTDFVKSYLNAATHTFQWPGLHNHIVRLPPSVAKPTPYAAIFTLNILSAAGTSCFFAALASAALLRMTPRRFARVFASTCRQLLFPMLTLAAVLALAYLMNYCGATATLGLAFAATGALFPFFSALLGWLGVFLTGSDTSANALFGNLQVVTANSLHLNPALMAAANSSGGVMGKMISLQSIAVAAAATGMPASDEAKLFRFTLRHSLFLASVIGLVALFYAYAAPSWVR